MVKTFKYYKFFCGNCNALKEIPLWSIDGIFESKPKCPVCGSSESLSEQVKQSNVSPYINTRFDFEKHVPAQTKEFLKEFKKRHGSSNTIKDY